MSQLAEGQHIPAPKNTLEITLPISGKVVVFTVPTWGQQKKMNFEIKQMKYSDEDASVLMMIRSATFDGKTLMIPSEIDDFDIRDVNYMSKKYLDFVDISERDEKNA